jgi:hypothetical protein
MGKIINIDFYRVSVLNDQTLRFNDLIEDVSALPVDNQRNLFVKDVPIRLQICDQRPDGITADMVRIRMNALPAKASLGGVIAPFDLNDDEGIGEETAFYYNIPRRIAVIQRNKFGVSAPQIAHYFTVKTGLGTLVFDPIFETETMIKYATMQNVRKFEVAIAGKQNPQIFNTLEAGLSSTVDMIQTLQAPSVDITVSMGHERGSLATRAVKAVADALLVIANDSPDQVKKIKITGSSTDEEQSALLNLLEDRMVETVDVPEDTNRRLSYLSRISAVRQAWQRRRDELSNMFPI